ncbi:MAG TPA: ABC transporter ATP-binding protein [Acidimicrobiales bacterium]
MTTTNDHVVSREQIVLASLTKTYGPVRAVRGIDLTLERGSTVALLGPNGAGKTTTIDMVIGLTRPDAGTVSLFGRSPSEAVSLGLISAMTQTGSLIDYLSVRELVTMMAGLFPNPLAVDEALSITGADAFADRQTRKLSGGETQRVRFAIALVANSDLLVLDEPTVALDVEGRRDFWTAMRAVAARGKTVVFATHYLEEADAYADRIVLMSRGRIVADGAPTEIKATVGGRVIRATLEDVDVALLTTIPGVTSAERHGDAVTLNCADSDGVLRHLVSRFAALRDIEVRGAGLEEAFLELTDEEDDDITSEGEP